MKDLKSLRQRVFDLGLTSMVLDAKFHIAELVETSKINLGIEDDDCCPTLCDQLAYEIDLNEAALAKAARTLWRATVPIDVRLTESQPSLSPHDAAVRLVRDFISDCRTVEFADYDTFNPEGVDRADLEEELIHTEELMYFALARLDDGAVQSILSNYQDTDHDGSRLTVATLEDVRHRASALA